MIVAFVGLPGSGKSTLALLVAQAFALPIALEAAEDNVFLSTRRFSNAPMTLENSLFFALDYMAAVYRHEDGFVYDSSIELDCAYARATLDDRDRTIVEAVGARFLKMAPPDLLVGLEATPALAKRRLAERDPEHPLLDGNWMERLDREVSTAFASSPAAKKTRVSAEWDGASAVIDSLRLIISA